MLNKYNTIAAFYPFLSFFMFGNSLINLQRLAIAHLPHHGKLLILGGGNGIILPYVYNARPNLQIEYLESSDKMIASARKKVRENQSIRFIHSSNISDCSPDINCVFAPFFFDIFSEEDITKILTQLETKIIHKFTLIVADFQITKQTTAKNIRYLQIKLSILFFKYFAKHHLTYLPDLFEVVEKCGFTALNTTYLQGKFLCLKVFTKHQ